MAVWRMRVACWILKATNTHSQYVIPVGFFHCNNGYMNAPRCHVIRALSCCTQDIPVALDTVWYLFTSHTIAPSDHLHPSPAPRFITFHVFLVYFPTRLNFSIIQNCSKFSALLVSIKIRQLFRYLGHRCTMYYLDSYVTGVPCII